MFVEKKDNCEKVVRRPDSPNAARWRGLNHGDRFRVLAADDHPVIRAAIAGMLANEPRSQGESEMARPWIGGQSNDTLGGSHALCPRPCRGRRTHASNRRCLTHSGSARLIYLPSASTLVSIPSSDRRAQWDRNLRRGRRGEGVPRGGPAPRVSHSAVSQALRRLEERLGVPLVRRTTRSVHPTEAGGSLRVGAAALDEVRAASSRWASSETSRAARCASTPRAPRRR